MFQAAFGDEAALHEDGHTGRSQQRVAGGVGGGGLDVGGLFKGRDLGVGQTEG